ncbi:MAG: hypothetical protein KDA61_19955, partial [Planctomycetales bacterium]|nr:hypothetical protein [Planctomycetales bacterium]
MHPALHELDELLRGERTRPARLAEDGLQVDVRRLALVVALLCMLYGACMGSYSLLKESAPNIASDDRYWQWLASAIKTPLLFALTLLITLPSLYVFNALVGSRLRLGKVLTLLVAS